MKCLIKIVLFTILITGVVAVMIPQSGDAPEAKGEISEIITTDFIESINTVRAEKELKPLKLHYRLAEGAYQRACDLQRSGQWSHDGYVEAFKKAGYTPYAVIGENLARDFDTDDQVLNGWLKSPSHAKNVYNPRMQDVGIGKCNGYVVLWLGREQ